MLVGRGTDCTLAGLSGDESIGHPGSTIPDGGLSVMWPILPTRLNSRQTVGQLILTLAGLSETFPPPAAAQVVTGSPTADLLRQAVLPLAGAPHGELPVGPAQQRSAFAVKKILFSVSALGALLAVLLTATQTQGQGQGQAQAQSGAARAQRPHQIGLIDMAHVFNNYDKFKAMQEGLQGDLKLAREKAQKSIERIKQLQEQAKAGTYKPESPEYKQLETEVIRLQTELEAYGRVTQAEQLRKEAEVYKQVYLEVQDAIRVYAEHYGYTLILRFDREAVETADNPQVILQRMTRQVVFHRGEDDLTNAILTHLNRQYTSQTAGRPAAGATR
jgi:outer membrane protein